MELFETAIDFVPNLCHLLDYPTKKTSIWCNIIAFLTYREYMTNHPPTIKIIKYIGLINTNQSLLEKLFTIK